jgi:hypothetical protein
MNGNPAGMDINETDHHVFVPDGNDRYVAEYTYPSGKLISTIPFDKRYSLPVGVAVDP